ncbi:MAG: Ig-like domain-containing protein, partial [Lachnospiraceae bacterium]|nr:Ig-like domain-containing protein [Lachnospiraceae bacterium]
LGCKELVTSSSGGSLGFQFTYDVLMAHAAGQSEFTSEGKTYTIDEDGVIYLTDIGAGDYSVELKPSDSLADYILPNSAQTVSVKAKVEYKVIANIKDEIKTEKEVNAAVEDNGNKAADVETEVRPSDTVEWVESTKTANGDAYVESAVDLSKTASADLSITKHLVAALRSITERLESGSRFVLGTPKLVAAAEDPDATGGTPDPTETQDPPAVHTDHTYGEWTTTKEPTCTEAGEKKRTCTYDGCEETETDSIPIDPQAHSFENGKCTRCGAPDPSATPSPTPTTTATPTPTTTPTPTPTPTAAAKVLVTGLALKPTEVPVEVGGNYQLTITVEPSNATEKGVTWATADANIAKVSDGGLVTGVKEGTTTVTATAKDGSGKTATATVKVGAKTYADTAQLYDKDKNPLYKKTGEDTYVLAKYADYKANKEIKLYKKTQGFLYTGWQTIDGKTYYYKKDNTYVTGDQIIGGVTYHFATDGSLTQGSGTLGIDVSKYQPSINWSSVKGSGVSFVIIRCGYRGATTGVLIEDPYFKSHIKGAKAAGLKVGVYFFTTAVTEAEAIEEASMCAYLCSGYGINYPVFMDCESSNRPGYNGLSAGERTKIIQAFCNTLKSAGYTPGVYANKTWLTEKMNASSLSGYKIWLAQYNSSGPTYNGRYDMWQYTSKGSVSGISGNVDMNQSYLGY